jgi:hypothetical protein
MQVAHSRSNWVGLPFGSVVVVLDRELVATLDGELAASPVLAALEVVEVVVLLTDATLGVFELPPHPATRTPLTSAAAASRRARGVHVNCFGVILSCIPSSFSGLPGSAHRFYATRGYRKVSLSRPPDEQCGSPPAGCGGAPGRHTSEGARIPQALRRI